MADEGEEQYDDKDEIINTLNEEIAEWKTKYKSLELKKKESDLALNKIKTEINSLRSVDKNWKESAKTVYLNLRDVKAQFDTQIDQVIDGFVGLNKVGERISEKVPYMKGVKLTIAKLQRKIREQEESIASLNTKIRLLTADLTEKNIKIEKLSQGIEEEVERLTKPMRDKLADAMMQIMKEKAARAQERRELADLWPDTSMLPTLLMRYRALSDDEKQRRLEIAKNQNANIALAIEIRANVLESRSWELKYDDYGRPFYEHNKTGEILWDPPEILNYKPPPGRDEMGNIEDNEENDLSNWIMQTDNKGQVYYKHKISDTITYISPNSYKRIPKGRSKVTIVGEAAQLVINYIKDKIIKHVKRTKKLREVLENPLTPEERLKKEKKEKNNPPVVEEEDPDDENDATIDLTAYQYDIETVEMLAESITNSAKINGDKDPIEVRAEKRSFLVESTVRSFDKECWSGPTLIETDIASLKTSDLRQIVEDLSLNEEKLEKRLERTRNNLRDFSYVLLEKVVEDDKMREKELKLEQMRIERENKLKRKEFLKEQKQKEKQLMLEREQMSQLKKKRRRRRKKKQSENLEIDPNNPVEGDPNTTSEQVIDSNVQTTKEGDEDVNMDDDEEYEDYETDSEDENENPIDLETTEKQLVTEDNEGEKTAENIVSDPIEPTNEVKIDDNPNDLPQDPSSQPQDQTVETVQSTMKIIEKKEIEESDSEEEEEEEVPIIETKTDYGALLFGDIEVDPIESSISQEMINLATNLVNFTVFCGFTNVHMNEGINESNYQFSLGINKIQNGDDEWLTNSFFITTSKEQLDLINETNSKIYDSSRGLLKIGPLDTEQLVITGPNGSKTVKPKDKPYTSGTNEYEDYVQTQFQLWKRRQLLSQVLRSQLQQQALREAYGNGIKAFGMKKNSSVTHFKYPITSIHLLVKKITFNRIIKLTEVQNTAIYFKISIGEWTFQTAKKYPGQYLLKWEDINYNSCISVNSIQIDNLILEMFDTDTKLLAFGNLNISNCLGSNIERDCSFDIELFDNKKVLLGHSNITVNAFYANEQFKSIIDLKDPHNLNKLKNSDINYNEINIDSKQNDLLNSGNSDPISKFDSLVQLLRGDENIHLVDLLSGDISLEHIEKKGYIIRSDLVQDLPNFAATSLFMKTKTNMHRWEIDKLSETIDLISNDGIILIQKSLEVAQRFTSDTRLKVRKVEDLCEDTKKEVVRLQKLVADCRIITTLPKEPEFPPFEDPPYVPALPTVGGLDSRGKKKKQIPTAQLKPLLESIEKGEVDAADPWPIPDPFWPSQSQSLKINKAIDLRNKVLDYKRSQEIAARSKAKEVYKDDMRKWEIMEQQRKIELERLKKEARKINLRYDCTMNRYARREKELNDLVNYCKILIDLKLVHEKARDRFTVMKLKQYMERKRQEEFLVTIKKRLLRALQARRYALDLPSSAKSEIEFSRLTSLSEESLRTLTVEVFDCRQLLLHEGVRLRLLFDEELRLHQNELARLKISKEIAFQRDAYDQILKKYKIDFTYLDENLEKLKLVEAEKDDIGVDTVEDMGTKYNEKKSWNTSEIIKCQRLINICEAKISLTEGLGISAGESQKSSLEVMITKWGNDFLPVRDSWSENSDYERSKQLLSDVLRWLGKDRKVTQSNNEIIIRDKNDIKYQLIATEEQNMIQLRNHEIETTSLSISAQNVIAALREEFNQVRISTKEQIDSLESRIIDLSRECHQIREELLAQSLIYEERMKLLWAFIFTLQTSIQQLAAKMEMIIEERDRIVISSKLIAERMRFQLRVERKHCSNLMFIIHSQRGSIRYMQDMVTKLTAVKADKEAHEQHIRNSLKKDIFEQIFCFTRLCTDVDSLFEFFSARLANLAGSRTAVNNALARNGAAQVLSALCKSPRPIIRKYASRAIGGLGWDGFVETRILLWDCVMYWKIFKSNVLEKEHQEYNSALDKYTKTDNLDAILNVNGEVEEFIPAGNMSLRTIIKQRRQWALRAARRNEGPNVANQRLLNIKDGVIGSLLHVCMTDGSVDWEIARNAALAISIASYEPQNHRDMINDSHFVSMIVKLIQKRDPEVQTHAAVTIANLCHQDETAQDIFGKAGAVEYLIEMLFSHVVDVLEATTSALANLTCFCDMNCKLVLTADGVKKTLRVLTEAYSENLLDLDQNDEVQANASELLANVSRFSSEDSIRYFDTTVIDALVLMCASPNKQLRRQVPLVIGNISQSETCRFEIGKRGGVESLFLAIEDIDTTVQANCLWALCNLMWHPPNQERAGRFVTEIVKFISAEWEPVRTHSSTLLANILFYSTSNRVRFLEIDGSIEMLISLVQNRDHNTAVVEGSLRSLLSLSYLDSIALWLGVDAATIPLFISFLLPPVYSREALRYSLEILCNLCLHHANRRTIYENGGIDAIVSLHIDSDHHLSQLSMRIIEYLEDITPAEVLARAKKEVGLERMVVMATNDDPLVRAVAAESIGEEIWNDNRKQQLAHKVGAVDALLGIATNANEAIESLLPSIWSLRNLMHNNPDSQYQFGYRDGISIINTVIQRAFTGIYTKHTEKLFEACLACLTNSIVYNEKNSRKLLMIGLESVLDLADGVLNSKNKSLITDNNILLQVKNAMKSEGIIALAKSILLMLAPYNYIVCRNCQKKQDLHGTSCYNCGNRLLTDNVEYKKDTFIIRKSKTGTISENLTYNNINNDNNNNNNNSNNKLMTSSSTSNINLKDIKRSKLSQTAPANIIQSKESNYRSSSS